MEIRNMVGRKRKFSTEQLINVIKDYIETEDYITKLTYVALAKFAKETYGYSNIAYNDFMRNSEIKKVIKEFNEKRKIISDIKTSNTEKLTFVSFEVDEFVDRYKNNSKLQRVILHKFNDNYKRAFNQVRKSNEEVKKLEEEIKKINKIVNDLSQINIKLKKENNELKLNKSIIKKQEKVNRKIAMYTELLNKGLIIPLEGDELINFINSSVGEKINDLVKLEKFKLNKNEEIKEKLKQSNNVSQLEDGKDLNVDNTIEKILNIFDK
ncbi:hypothetical protein [Clostridium cagae]|uniref:hypothetical protein n=1 Tax=Clostridium cagae TaxID=2080751 RepID=UPI000CF6886C|nr:hypothetical protein [Clostridium cagae]